jgi:O-antigen ligase
VQLELLALLAFAFVLPLWEAPKNLFWLLYVALWLANRQRAHDYGGPWEAWDSLIVVWIASGYVAATFAGLHNSEWSSAFDILRYGSVLWLLKRARYGEDVLYRLFTFALLGTLAALAWGYYGLVVTRQREHLGLNSVGHVNHSAIYVAIAFGFALAWLRAVWRTKKATQLATGIAVCLVLALSMVVMQSGAIVGVGFIIGFAILGAYALRSRKRPWPILGVALVIGIGVFAANPEVIRKNALRLQENHLLAYRDVIWRTGLEAWRQFPMFGVGMGNYGKVNHERLAEWSRARGEPFEKAVVMPTTHGHSLYLNTLVERGVVGLGVLLVVVGAWGWALARNVPQLSDSAMRWAYWGGALTAWLVAVLVGVVNTTLHHEHALFSMVLLGGWLGLRGNQLGTPAPSA